jgi:hypothetical protein
VGGNAHDDEAMRAVWYSWRGSRRRTWRSALTVMLLCALLGSVALAALAGARRTESAYGRYLKSINSSDVFVNIPSPDLSLNTRVSKLPGITSSAAWLGFNANPVVHGHVDYSFVTNGFEGTKGGEFFTQDTMTVVAGHLPALDAADAIVLTPKLARLFGVGVGGRVTYQLINTLAQSPSNLEPVAGELTFTVAAIAELPPDLVDQFDQVQSAVIPPAATLRALRLPGALQFSWVGARLRGGSAEIPAFQKEVQHLAVEVGNGYGFSLRRLDTVHAQVQEAIRPQAVALGVFGGFALLALLVLVGQALAQMFDRIGADAETLRALGLSRLEISVVCGLGGALAVFVGLVVAIVGAVALSDLAPVGPVRAIDPARGFQFDATVLAGGSAVLLVVLSALMVVLAWRAVRPVAAVAADSPSVVVEAATASGLPPTVALGAGYALGAAPGRGRSAARVGVIGSVVAVASVVMAAVFAASLNGLVTHPEEYGWNWQTLVQDQGGYGSFLPFNVSPATIGNGEGPVDGLMARQAGVAGWSTFGFTQIEVDGRSVPVLGLATHGRTAVEPPTVSGHALTDTAPGSILRDRGPNEIELGQSTMRQLGTRVGATVSVAASPGDAVRRLRVVGAVTLPSIGVELSDHVSLGRGAMVPETTLLSIEHLSELATAPAEAFSALPSTIAIQYDDGASPTAVVNAILRLNPGGVPGSDYQVSRVLGAEIVNASQMGGQPVALSIVLAVAVLISLSATVVVATRRRRRELAVLRSLGLTGGQMRTIIVTQTTSLLVVALLFGVPLGIAGGHWAWASFAGSLGVVPVIAVPALALLIGAAALLVAGPFAALPAMLAARAPTTLALRAE